MSDESKNRIADLELRMQRDYGRVFGLLCVSHQDRDLLLCTLMSAYVQGQSEMVREQTGQCRKMSYEWLKQHPG